MWKEKKSYLLVWGIFSFLRSDKGPWLPLSQKRTGTNQRSSRRWMCSIVQCENAGRFELTENVDNFKFILSVCRLIVENTSQQCLAFIFSFASGWKYRIFSYIHTESSKESEMKKSAAQNIDSINFFVLHKSKDLSIKEMWNWQVFKVKMIKNLSLKSYHIKE